MRRAVAVDDLPLVSIVTPSYNQGQFIEETILSVLRQDYPRLEYWVIDGGSTDETLSILRRYEGQLKWLSERDAGQSDALNKGARLTQGEIWTWLNSDDTYCPGAVRYAVESLRSHPEAAFVCGTCNLIDEHGQVFGMQCESQPTLQRALEWNQIPQPATFLRRSALGVVGWLDTSIHTDMDFDLWLRLLVRFTAVHDPRIRANFRLHSASKTQARAKVGDAHWRIVSDFFDRPDLPSQVRALEHMACAHAWLFRAGQDYADGRSSEARHFLWHAVSSYPGVLRRSIFWTVLFRSFVPGSWMSTLRDWKRHADLTIWKKRSV